MNATLLTPAARKLVRAVSDAGGRPLIVGGAVRDTILSPGGASRDLDVEVYGLDHDQLVAALRPVGKVDTFGAHFAVTSVRIGDETIDVSLPRRDNKSGSGHRGFTIEADPTMTPVDAASRRDFTINAIMFDPVAGELVDPHGGVDDLRAGVLRHTSEAFSEDVLRVLRGIQFVARFGLDVHPDTMWLFRYLASEYDLLPIERVWQEWYKLVTRGTHISAAMSVLAESGWVHHYPELAACIGVAQHPGWHPEGDVFTHQGLAADVAARQCELDGTTGDDRAVIVLATLVHDIGKPATTHLNEAGEWVSPGHAAAGVEPATAFLASIGAPRHIIERVLPLVREHMTATTTQNGPTAAAVRRLVRRLEPATIHEWAAVITADRAGRGRASKPSLAPAWLALAHDVGDTPGPGLLTGQHLIDAGLTPGPVFKTILSAALKAQDAGAFDTVEGALGWFRSHYGTK